LTPGDLGANVVFSPDDQWLLTAHEASYKLWRTATWQLEREFSRKEIGQPGMSAFSHDGKMLALTDTTRQVRIVDPANGTELATLPSPHLEQRPNIYDVCFNADDSGLYVAGHVDFFWDLRKIRARLAVMGLDWDAPAYSPAATVALPLFVRILAEDPKYALAEELAKAGELEQAVKTYDLLIANRPADAEIRKKRGDLKARLELWGDAEDDYLFYVSRNPQDYYAQMRLGILLAYHEKAEAYRQHCEAVVARLERTAPDSATCFRSVKTCGYLPNSLDRYETLEKLANQAVGGSPDYAVGWLAAGMAAHRRGDQSQSLKLLTNGLEIAVRRNDWAAHPSILMMLCLVHQKLGDQSAAQEFFEQAVKIATDHLAPHKNEATWWHDWLSYEILRREATRLGVSK
jgi:tetratricopeptide (TPR) repeat protein